MVLNPRLVSYPVYHGLLGLLGVSSGCKGGWCNNALCRQNGAR